MQVSERLHTWQLIFGGYTPLTLLIGYHKDRVRFLSVVLLEAFSFGPYKLEDIEQTFRFLPVEVPEECRDLPRALEELLVVGRRVEQRIQLEGLTGRADGHTLDRIRTLIAVEVNAHLRLPPPEPRRNFEVKGRTSFPPKRAAPWMAHLDHTPSDAIPAMLAQAPDVAFVPHEGGPEDDDGPITVTSRPWTLAEARAEVDPEQERRTDPGPYTVSPEGDTLDELPIPRTLAERQWRLGPGPQPPQVHVRTPSETPPPPVRNVETSRERRKAAPEILSLMETLAGLRRLALQDDGAASALVAWSGQLKVRLERWQSGHTELPDVDGQFFSRTVDGLATLAHHAAELLHAAEDEGAHPWQQVRALEKDVDQLRRKVDEGDREIARLRRLALWHHLQASVARVRTAVAAVEWHGDRTRTAWVIQQWQDILQIYQVLERKVPPEAMDEIRPEMEQLAVAVAR